MSTHKERRNTLIREVKEFSDGMNKDGIDMSVRVHLNHSRGNIVGDINKLVNQLDSLPDDMYISQIQIIPSVVLDTKAKEIFSVKEDVSNDDA